MTEPITVADDSSEADLIGLLGETSVETASARLEAVLRSTDGGTVYLATKADTLATFAFSCGAAEVIWLGPVYVRFSGLHNALGVDAMARCLEGDELEGARQRWHALRESELGILLTRGNYESVVDGDPVLIRMSEVEPQPVDWLWQKRLPVGKVSLLSGPPGLGKSLLTLDMAARVSRGRDWPDGSPCAMGSVVLLACEDDPGTTIRPRLDAAGADPERVVLLDGVHRVQPSKDKDKPKRSVVMFGLADLDPLERTLQRLGDVRLVIIDPIGSFFGADRDSNTDTQVRSLLAPLAALAQKYQVAIVLIAHTRKSAATTADESVLGSRAFTGVARAVYHVAEDPQETGRRLLLAGKCNLAIAQQGLGFRLFGITTPAVVWDRKPVTVTADEVVGKARKPGSRTSGTAHWLQEVLRPAPMSAGEVRETAKDAGYRWRTVQDAADHIGVTRRKVGFNGPWLWSRPGDPDPPPEPQSVPTGPEPGREASAPSGSSTDSGSIRQSEPRHGSETSAPSTESPNGGHPCEDAGDQESRLRANRQGDAELAQDPQGAEPSLPGSGDDLDQDLIRDGGGW